MTNKDRIALLEKKVDLMTTHQEELIAKLETLIELVSLNVTPPECKNCNVLMKRKTGIVLDSENFWECKNCCSVSNSQQ